MAGPGGKFMRKLTVAKIASQKPTTPAALPSNPRVSFNTSVSTLNENGKRGYAALEADGIVSAEKNSLPLPQIDSNKKGKIEARSNYTVIDEVSEFELLRKKRQERDDDEMYEGLRNFKGRQRYESYNIR